ncbi:MAG: CDP-alcohol phosphatidyltransferase family protein [Bacteriovoracaceae bacterium]|jgi:CDP-diacylglycerol---glycerol-3-phosphate 3-phosphatidyltransferase|nr:CDP-alcohol phosphatidyltransferase family protein [Bacteriovoracaceae bacterium]
MTIYDLKPLFQNLLRPIVLLLKNLGLTPNQVTLATCVLSLGMAILLYFNSHVNLVLFSIPVFMFFRMALNAIDGMMAKDHDMQTPLGALLNELTDVLADSALYLAFVSHPLINAKLIIPISLLAVMTELIGISTTTIGASRRYDGPMGKSDRAFVFGFLALLLGLEIQYPILYTGILSLTLLLLVLTIKNRMFRGLKEVT